MLDGVKVGESNFLADAVTLQYEGQRVGSRHGGGVIEKVSARR